MNQVKRIVIVGHPGAGKAVLGQALAEKLAWQFIDADYGIEVRTGALVDQILGDAGNKALRATEKEILSHQTDHTVIVTDVGIVTSPDNRACLENEYVVFVTVSLATQLERMSRHVEPLLRNSDRNALLTKLHDRDAWFNEVANITINTDDNALDRHVETIIKHANLADLIPESPEIKLGKKDLVLHHYTTHQPVHLSKQQAICVKLLSQGKSAKEIAQELDISYRTVEGYLAKVMELLGCASSKELISLYLNQQ